MNHIYTIIILILIDITYSFTLSKGLTSSRQICRFLSMRISKPSLDDNTLWQLSLTFKSPNNTNTEMITKANLRIRFINYRGYEPPHGRIFIQDDYNGVSKVDEAGYNGVWSLSEDKNDRKDGLWIWRLFEEPKFPYLYFYLDVYDTIVTGKGEELPIYANKMPIPDGRLNFRFDHYRDSKAGVALLNGCMTYKITELVNMDPPGLGGKDSVGDSISAGTVSIVAITEVDVVVD